MRYWMLSGLITIAACSHHSSAEPVPMSSVPSSPTLTRQSSGTTERLQAISVVSEQVAWASGAGGTYVRTTDGGATWHAGTVPGADSLEFRDVDAADAQTAWLLSSGNGRSSRIYRTTDGGTHWTLQFTNSEPEAFYDCFGFWDRRSGIAFSDNVRGVFPILRTDDGGEHWTLMSDPAAPSASTAPPATTGEGAFAASGTCLETQGSAIARIGTGAGEHARVLFTPDRGRSWQSLATPIIQGKNTQGITSLGFRDMNHGFAVGGDIANDTAFSDNVVLTSDGGHTWSVGGRPTFTGAIYGAVYVPGARSIIVAVGPHGASLSTTEGKTWSSLDNAEYWSAGFASAHAGWLVGTEGRITKVTF